MKKQGHTLREQQQIIRMERLFKDTEDRLAKLNQALAVAEMKLEVVTNTADAVAGVLGAPQAANTVLAGPAAGAAAAPTWRALVAADVPSLDAAKIASGILAIGRLASGTPDGTKFVRDDSTLAVPA